MAAPRELSPQMINHFAQRYDAEHPLKFEPPKITPMEPMFLFSQYLADIMKLQIQIAGLTEAAVWWWWGRKVEDTLRQNNGQANP